MTTTVTVRCANETCAHRAEHHSNLPGPYPLTDLLQTLRNQGWLVLDDETAYCPRCRKEYAA